MTPEEYGEQVASTWPPLTRAQVEEIAKILVTVTVEQEARASSELPSGVGGLCHRRGHGGQHATEAIT